MSTGMIQLVNLLSVPHACQFWLALGRPNPSSGADEAFSFQVDTGGATAEGLVVSPVVAS